MSCYLIYDGMIVASQIQPQRDSPCKTDSTRGGPRSFATSHEDTRTDITGENKASLNGGNEKDSLQLLFKQFVGNAVGLGVQSGGQDMVGIPDHAGHGGAIGAFGAHGCLVWFVERVERERESYQIMTSTTNERDLANPSCVPVGNPSKIWIQTFCDFSHVPKRS